MMKREIVHNSAVEKIKEIFKLQRSNFFSEKELDDIIRPTIRVEVGECLEKLPIGISKMGGEPDLPPYIEYPLYKGSPLAFVAQLNLEDLHPFDQRNELPSKGMLYFFYDTDDLFATYQAQCRVIYVDAKNEDLKRISVPSCSVDEFEIEGPLFKEATVSFKKEYTVPESKSHFIEQKAKAIYGTKWRENTDFYSELENQVIALEEKIVSSSDGKSSYSVDCTNYHHHLLGWSHSVQNPVEEECENMSKHESISEEGESINPDLGEVFNKASNESKWRLLFEIADNIPEIGLEWGGGRIYFMMREKDFRNFNFVETYAIYQCT